MRKNIYLIIMTFLFIACSKERFNNTDNYMTTFVFNIQSNGNTKIVNVNRFIELRNETKNSIEFDGIMMEKNGLIIDGILPLGSFPIGTLSSTQAINIELKRKFLGSKINGTLNTMTFFEGDWRETTGTIEMTPN